MSKPTENEPEEAQVQRDRLIEELEIIYQMSPDMIGSGNLAGYFRKVNPSFGRILGYTDEEFCARPFLDFVHPEDYEATERALRSASEGEEHIYIENRYQCRDGRYKWIEWKVCVIAERDTFIAVGRDVTERKEAEREHRILQRRLGRSEKMEALGLLAGGVAHDLNNILSGLVSYPELLLLDLPRDSEIRGPLQTILESGLRAQKVVDDLLTLARGVTRDEEVVDLNVLVNELLTASDCLSVMQRFPRVRVETRLDEELPNIKGSPVHFQKTVLNLVINAIEAIGHEEPGLVTLSTAAVLLDEPLCGHDSVPVGHYVRLTVADDGVGITEEDVTRIFEPFYTKKKMGRSGTGLGLFVVWNTMRDHGGYINVVSGEGGTSFELYFPVTTEARVTPDVVDVLDLYRGCGETVLVVDDEALQRTIACDILDRLGYRAAAVSSGDEAVEFLRETQVDLMLLDMVMPGRLNGLQTFERIKKDNPDQRAVIVSGLSDSADIRKVQALGAGVLVKKPYTIDAIGRAVRDTLEQGSR